MIIYNIRANGPYEYDKFILNYGQLHNLVTDTKEMYRNHTVQEQKHYLTDKINELLDPEHGKTGLMNQVAMIRQMIME